MKNLKKLFLASTLFLILPACMTSSDAPPKNSSNARLNLPNWGITIDASYDPKLDNIVPGYKLITVALTNRSVDLIKFDPTGDQWFIEDSNGKKLRGIISLRARDPQVWSTLPPKVKDLVEYPAGVQMGFTQTFNLFYPDGTELARFRAISFYSANLKQNFDALSSASLERAVPASDEAPGESFDKFAPTPSPKINGVTKPPKRNPKAEEKYR
ncbi:MAG: hypothetical protein JNK65_01595 [Deltaproteobacteria bacterium]|nr:hypothetical protein [Deltaproteobacteria bacterium]